VRPAPPSTSHFLGDLHAERTVLLSYVPADADVGVRVRSLWLLAGEDCATTPEDHWLLELGKVSGTFRGLAPAHVLQGLLVAGRMRQLPLGAPVLLGRGVHLAVRLRPRGQPPPLVGACLAVDYGTQATPAPARRR
jgi:hypothetical protein